MHPHFGDAFFGLQMNMRMITPFSNENLLVLCGMDSV
jgi:hypothetical protein